MSFRHAFAPTLLHWEGTGPVARYRCSVTESIAGVTARVTCGVGAYTTLSSLSWARPTSARSSRRPCQFLAESSLLDSRSNGGETRPKARYILAVFLLTRRRSRSVADLEVVSPCVVMRRARRVVALAAAGFTRPVPPAGSTGTTRLVPASASSSLPLSFRYRAYGNDFVGASLESVLRARKSRESAGQ